ncbi:MAG: spore maturation protein [Clostridiales bacterium]|nr:MAG: spore maturation protein [Clostridiales bacterium]
MSATRFIKSERLRRALSRAQKRALKTVVSIFAPILAILVAVNMLKGSGAMDIFTAIVTPFARLISFPAEMVPFALFASNIRERFARYGNRHFPKTCGTDSFVGRAVSTLMGSTETTFYTLSVYFGAVKIKNMRHSVKCALIADIVGIFVSVAVCRLVFRISFC